MIRHRVFLATCLLALLSGSGDHPGAAAPQVRLVFATFAEEPQQLRNVVCFVESVRAFAGTLKDSRFLVYMPAALLESASGLRHTLEGLHAETRTSAAPADALAFPFARKVFAAAQAETEVGGQAEILAWTDDDTVVLQEPREFLLPKGVSLAYRPVMHRLIGSSYDEPPDAFWRRVYEKLSVRPAAIFPMVTPADNQKVRAYFNAGMLVVRPERGVLRHWASSFPVLYRDPMFAEWCRQDRVRHVFLHQAALAGAILSRLERPEMIELDLRYNFPLFFKEMFGAEREFDSITGVVTLRHESYFRNPAPDWEKKLKGPPDTVKWLVDHLVGR